MQIFLRLIILLLRKHWKMKTIAEEEALINFPYNNVKKKTHTYTHALIYVDMYIHTRLRGYVLRGTLTLQTTFATDITMRNQRRMLYPVD